MHQSQRPRMPGSASREDIVTTSPSRAHALSHQYACNRASSAYDRYSTSFSRTSAAHNAGPCCLETSVDTRHPCAPRAHTAHHPYSYHTVCRRSSPVLIYGPKTKPFLAHQPNARHPGNKAAASAHGMGPGDLTVDAMSIGCLGVDRSGERFFRT